jgi:flagellar hook-length control protein FliK
MYASLAIQPPVPSQPANASPPSAPEAQGFGDALRRAVAAPASAPGGGAVAADAAAATLATPAIALATPTGTVDPAVAADPAALLPSAFVLAVTELAPALPATAKAAADTPEVPEDPSAASPMPDAIITMPGLVMAPPPPPPPLVAPPADTMPALAPSAAATPTAPPNTLQSKATQQRGTAAAALPQDEHGFPLAEAVPQPASPAAQPAPVLPVVPALPPVAHEHARNARPQAAVSQAEAAVDAQAALLSAMQQTTGEAPRAAPRAAPMPPARQAMPMAMAMLLSPGTTPTLSVTLDPAELGRLEIRVGREAGGASLRLIAERPETLSLLVRDQRDLQQGLAQSGITLNADGIRFEMAEQDGQSRQEQQRRPGRGRPQADSHSTSPQQAVQLSLLDIRI